jgi:HlyD family secretion protein
MPAASLFRSGDGWAVFVVEDGRARARTVRIGERNPLEAQVIEGLSEGEMVIRHPPNDLVDGARVRVLREPNG